VVPVCRKTLKLKRVLGFFYRLTDPPEKAEGLIVFTKKPLKSTKYCFIPTKSVFVPAPIDN
jgi:hypothetical protein